MTFEEEVIERVLARLEALGSTYPAMRGFSARGRRDFILYEHDVTWAPDPEYARKLAEFEKRLPMPGVRAGVERPSERVARFGPQGIRICIRIDPVGGFPLLVPPDRRFGDRQFSIIEVDGPATDEFHRLRGEILAILRDEASIDS